MMLDNAKRQGHIIIRVEDLENAFPELVESEDEKIRKELIQFIKNWKNPENIKRRPIDYPLFTSNEEQCNKYISWLEKQGEPQKELAETYLAVFDKKFPILPTLKGKQLSEYKNFLNKCQQIFGLQFWGSRPTQAKLFEKLSLLWATWGAGHLQGLGQIKDDEKQKDDKIKPNFKVGDWIVNNISKDIFMIKSINNGYCTLEDIKGNIISPCLPPCESESHLWTVQDAKDGDVLATNKGVFIYAKVLYNKAYAYCGIDKFGVFKDNYLNTNWTNSVDNIHPATKEQRDTLMKEMVNAGYTFNSGKIKKINE